MITKTACCKDLHGCKHTRSAHGILEKYGRALCSPGDPGRRRQETNLSTLIHDIHEWQTVHVEKSQLNQRNLPNYSARA